MPLQVADLKIYGSASMPDDNTPTNIGGAVTTSKKPAFTDVGGSIQAVSSSGADVNTITVHYRDVASALQSQAVALSGTSPVVYAATVERLMKALKTGSSGGNVAVEAQIAERTGTAQVGSTAYSIRLDAGASAADNFFLEMIVRITAGTGVDQTRECYSYVGATKDLFINHPWVTIPDGSSVFRISKGFYFDKLPVEVTEVRRVWFDARANAPGGGAVSYYDKVFMQNSSTAFSLLTAQVKLAIDSTGGRAAFGLEATINGTGTNGGGNNRTVAPGGIVFGTSPVTVPGTDLMAGSSIGVWLRLALLDGDAAQKTSVTMQLTGSSA